MRALALLLALVAAARAAGPGGARAGLEADSSIAAVKAAAARQRKVAAYGESRLTHEWKRCMFPDRRGRVCLYSCDDGKSYSFTLEPGRQSCPELLWVRK